MIVLPSCHHSRRASTPEDKPKGGTANYARLHPGGIEIAWLWLDQAATVDLIRIRMKTSGDPGDPQVVGQYSREVSRHLDAEPEPGIVKYRVVFLGHDGVDVGSRDHEIHVPSVALDLEPPIPATLKPYFPSVGDLDGDGRLEVLGAVNHRRGLVPVPAWYSGLGDLFAPGRFARDARLADLDGDGDLDVVANAYSRLDDGASRAQLYWNLGNGVFRRDRGFDTLDIGGYGETIVTFDYDGDGDVDVFLPYYSHNDSREVSAGASAA